MKCKDCRKLEAESTWWERTRYKLMHYLFAEDVVNLVQEKYTQGFADGRKMGYKACLDQEKTKEEAFKEMIRDGVGKWLEPFNEDK